MASYLNDEIKTERNPTVRREMSPKLGIDLSFVGLNAAAGKELSNIGEKSDQNFKTKVSNILLPYPFCDDQ